VVTDSGDKLWYCRVILLPIWERWTDGHPALRRALECATADPDAQRQRQQRLQQVMARLQARGRSPSVRAAIAVGWAGLYCLRNAPEEILTPACARAHQAHAVALAVS
jgi:hypothetical protein